VQGSADTYEVIRDSDGQLREVVRAGDRLRVPIDVENQDFCDFLTWASHQRPRVDLQPFRIKPGGVYFSDKGRLVEYWKQKGRIIYTAPEPLGNHHHIQTGEITYRGTHEQAFHGLLEAVAPAEDREGDARGIAGKPSSVFVTEKTLKGLQEDLQKEDDPIRRMSAWPIERCFVYIDISDFSKYPPGKEVLIINVAVGAVQDARFWDSPLVEDAWRSIEAQLCIGDGYIFVLKDPLLATCFAAYLAQLIEELVARRITPVEFHFRIGVHCGPVYCFWDPGRKDWNFIGDGINGGQRVLSLIKDADDTLYISGQVRQKIIAKGDESTRCRTVLAGLRNRGRQADKHGKLWRVYEVSHTELAAGGLAQFVRRLVS
jgi:class 3 adenylate cyclase